MQGSVPNEEIERYAVTLSHICVCFDPFFFNRNQHFRAPIDEKQPWCMPKSEK